MIPRKPLAVGDRVRLKGYSKFGVRVDGRKGEIAGRYEGDYEIRFGDGVAKVLVTPSQCRRLVRKERRRVWIHLGEGRYPLTAHTSMQVGAVEFLEVRRSK